MSSCSCLDAVHLSQEATGRTWPIVGHRSRQWSPSDITRLVAEGHWSLHRFQTVFQCSFCYDVLSRLDRVLILQVNYREVYNCFKTASCDIGVAVTTRVQIWNLSLDDSTWVEPSWILIVFLEICCWLLGPVQCGGQMQRRGLARPGRRPGRRFRPH